MPTEQEERRRRTIELVIAVAVVAISLASLFTAVYQSIVMRRTLEASVWPRVEWETSNYDEKRRVHCYCSVFDQCWTARARAYRQATQRVGRCPTGPEPGFIG